MTELQQKAHGNKVLDFLFPASLSLLSWLTRPSYWSFRQEALLQSADSTEYRSLLESTRVSSYDLALFESSQPLVKFMGTGEANPPTEHVPGSIQCKRCMPHKLTQTHSAPSSSSSRTGMQWSQTPVRRVASDLAMKVNKVPKRSLPLTQLVSDHVCGCIGLKLDDMNSIILPVISRLLAANMPSVLSLGYRRVFSSRVAVRPLIFHSLLFVLCLYCESDSSWI